MFSVSPDIYEVLSVASRWIFAFFALMLLVFALVWHHAERKERKERFKNLPGAGTVGELIVLSGSDELAEGTWFPVPREGVLGSLRSCDLVIPCPGVSSQHLDFSWQDGSGLLIRPRVGCEALIDGTPVTRRFGTQDKPLLHGSVLQVGTAALRLQLYAALSHTNRTFTPPVPFQGPETGYGAPQAQPPVQYPAAAMQPWAAQPMQAPVPQEPPEYVETIQYMPEPVQAAPEPAQPEPQQPAPARPRRSRSERWKEDWSE